MRTKRHQHPRVRSTHQIRDMLGLEQEVNGYGVAGRLRTPQHEMRLDQIGKYERNTWIRTRDLVKEIGSARDALENITSRGTSPASPVMIIVKAV